MDMIVAEGLTKFYRKFLAVDHVSFKVEEGKIFGFLGPNGAGKTTTVKMLNTLISISDGRAFINGFDVSKEKSRVRRSIGVVPQELTLDREMTGKQVLKIQAKLYDVPDDTAKERMDELLKLAGLQEFADREIAAYSGGMQKRLELIMGLVHQPKVLFLDEPTVGLDAQSRALIWEYIRKFSKDFHTTIFLTTHYLEEADELCDRVAIISDGKIGVEGSPAQLKNRLGEDEVEILFEKIYAATEIEDILRSVSGVVGVSVMKDLCKIRTVSSERSLAGIVTSLSNKDIQIKTVNARKATLNQVFIKHLSGEFEGSPEEENGPPSS
ncbi:MAG: ATP-binding cassette domain-containing protein [Thaumarchaeota archaeon]|nr:ATP-binding cassette domain-containing protein [Nitrososphaerota archaeon]MDG6906105.1 ATP-binding cassette domain-containing protein [Nitrososphaerota archaeon]